MNNKENESDGSGPTPMQLEDLQDNTPIRHDAVFGEITEDGPNYRNVCFSVSLRTP